MKKRLLAMLLALMLVVSLLPVGVLAADGDTVNRIRLMDKNAWGLAAIEKAGYSNEDVLWSNITSIRFFASDGSYTNWGVARDEAPDCYSHEGYLATDAGTKIVPSSVDRIVVELQFAYKGWEAGKIISATAVFHDEEFTLDYSEGSAGVREYAEFTLKSGQSYDKDHSVTFYFQPIGKADWELYDIVYVDDGERIGSDMPADPNYGSQNFVSWQTNTDGSGDALTSETVINKDWVVYGTKTSAGGATAYHVMRDSTGGRYNALQDEVADIYNAANDTAYNSGNVQITAIQVNGNGDEHTNPDYFRNGWNDDSTYYDIYNVDAYAADATPDKKNTRIPVNEVTGITLIGTIGGDSFSVTIPKDELSLQEITNPVTTDTIVEIKVYDKLDGITKELVESAEYAPEGVTGVSYPVDGKVTIPEDGSVTLLYKITVTGDQNAEYIVTDDGAAVVSGSLSGKLDTTGIAEIYVTKTFAANDIVDDVLTNSACLKNDNTTLPPDDGNNEDEATVEAEVDGETPDPDPEEPPKPTKDDLGKLSVILDCTNETAEHANKTFHMNTGNCTVEIESVDGIYICTVTPNYTLILERYNEQVAGGHTYADEVGSEKTFTLVWTGEAWDNGNASPITRQVKCDTPEPDIQHVDVYAVKDRNYDTRVLIGSFMAPVGTNVINFVEAQELDEPKGFDKYEPANDGYYKEGLQYTFGENDTVSGRTNVYVNYIGKEQTVQVVIYRNGDTTTPYKTESIGPMRTGETLNIADLDINEYYTPDKFATGFVYEGWFNDGAWNNYVNAGCPEDAEGLDEIYINGWTNVIAMVWDQFPVYYNIVDENGTVVEEKIYTDTITERDLEDYTFYDASRTGYTFDGWYQDEKDVGDASKLLTGLNMAKKWELYGRYDPIPYNLVIYAAIDKDKDNAVEIYSGMVDYGTPLVEYLESLTLETDVFPGYSPEDGKWYKYDSPAWTFGESDTVAGWTNVLLNYVPNEYTLYYHGNGGATESGAIQSTSTFKYGSEATIKNNPFTYDGYVFEGWAQSADGEVVYTGSEKVPFTEENFP